MYKVPLKLTYRILMLFSVLGQSIFSFYPSQYLFYFSLVLFLFAFPLFIIDFKGMFRDFTLMTILIILFLITPFILEISKNGDWVSTSIFSLLYPALFEETIFRGLLSNMIKRRGIAENSIITSTIYSIYYSRFVVLNNFRAFPYPYNLIMIMSVFSMGLMYSLLDLKFKSLYPSIIIHYAIWAYFPLITALSPPLSSILVPT